MTPYQLIERCKQNGIELWAKPGDKIGFRSVSPLPTRVIETLKSHKAKLLPLLPLVDDAAPVLRQEPVQSVPGIPMDIIALGAEIDAELAALEEAIYDEAAMAAMHNRMPVFDSSSQKGICLTPGTVMYNPGAEFLRCLNQRKRSLARLKDEDLSNAQRIWQELHVASAEGGMDNIAFWWWLWRKDGGK